MLEYSGFYATINVYIVIAFNICHKNILNENSNIYKKYYKYNFIMK